MTIICEIMAWQRKRMKKNNVNRNSNGVAWRNDEIIRNENVKKRRRSGGDGEVEILPLPTLFSLPLPISCPPSAPPGGGRRWEGGATPLTLPTPTTSIPLPPLLPGGGRCIAAENIILSIVSAQRHHGGINQRAISVSAIKRNISESGISGMVISASIIVSWWRAEKKKTAAARCMAHGGKRQAGGWRQQEEWQ